MSEQDAALDLSEAEAALERGDYGQGLELLLPLAEQHPLNSPEGPGLRLLMITAWMGQGQDEKAIATCRLLSRCRDPKLRQQAKQLLGVLEAPSLDRPERWSMRMPQLELNGSGSGQTSTMRRRRSRRPEPPPPPPTGPTRSPAAGFAVLVMAVLLGITLLLSGCVRIEADLDLRGPDRLALTWDVRSTRNARCPGRSNSSETCKQRARAEDRTNRPRTPTDQQPCCLIARAGATDGGRGCRGWSRGWSLTPATDAQARRTQLAAGVQQHVQLMVDLSDLPEIPGLDVHLSLNHGQVERTAVPAPPPKSAGRKLALESAWPGGRGDPDAADQQHGAAGGASEAGLWLP